MKYGDLGKRVVASIIDSVVIFLGALLLYGIAVIVPVLAPVIVILTPFMSAIYSVLMEGSSWHATVGKKMMGLYVADINGNGIHYSTAILRLIGKWLSGFILCVGYLMAFFNEQKQGLHDMIAKTYVLEGSLGKGVVRHELVGVTGPMAGMIYKVGEEGLVIGRDSVSCQVVLPSTQSNVSRIHCFVTYNPMSGMFVLNDRNSSQGTFLANGRRVPYAQPIALRSGDRFYLASPENTFEVR